MEDCPRQQRRGVGVDHSDDEKVLVKFDTAAVTGDQVLLITYYPDHDPCHLDLAPCQGPWTSICIIA